MTHFLLRQNYISYMFNVLTFFADVRITLYFGTCELRMEMTWQLRFSFSRHCDVFLLRYNYVIYFFDVVTFLDDVRNRFCFGTFKLHMEITLQLRSIFVRHCNIFFIMSQLRYLFVRCSYGFWWR